MIKISYLVFFIFSSILFFLSYKIYFSLDGLNDLLFTLISKDMTFYSQNYSEAKFKEIEIGMTKKEVEDTIGAPISILWKYDILEIIIFKNDIVKISTLKNRKIEGMAKKKVKNILGLPKEERWSYSGAPIKAAYRVRAIIFKDDKVIKIRHHINFE